MPNTKFDASTSGMFSGVPGLPSRPAETSSESGEDNSAIYRSVRVAMTTDSRPNQGKFSCCHIRRKAAPIVLVQRRAYRGVIVEHEPFDHRHRQGTIADQLIVEGAEAKVSALAVAIAAEQTHDLPLAGDVRDLL